MNAAQQEASSAQKQIDNLSKEKKSLEEQSNKTCEQLEKA